LCRIHVADEMFGCRSDVNKTWRCLGMVATCIGDAFKT
jgi:hypothetical protein